MLELKSVVLFLGSRMENRLSRSRVLLFPGVWRLRMRVLRFGLNSRFGGKWFLCSRFGVLLRGSVGGRLYGRCRSATPLLMV